MGFIYACYKLSNYLYHKKIPVLPKIIQHFIHVIFSCYIPCTAQIGNGTIFNHAGLGVIIHEHAVIGTNCLINPGVVIGGNNHKQIVPKIGNNVLLGAGAKIIGSVTIGNNVVIGANAVVVNDIPNNSLAVGVPARVIKTNIDIHNYL